MITDLYAVIGNPIAHSRSPILFNAAFKELGMDALYIRLASRNVEDAVRVAKILDLKGFNVTAPFKESIIPLLDGVDESAGIVGAVNTVTRGTDGLVGHNTDGYGAATALEENGADLKNDQVLILGAGGAAKAVAGELSRRGVKITIANRTLDKAKALGNSLNCDACCLDGPEFTPALKEANAIVSCISSPDRIIPKDLLNKDQLVLDANYFNMSPLVQDAIGAGCGIVDGMEWLLYQGAKAFTILNGQAAPVDAMRRAVYELKKRFRDTNLALIGPMGSGKSSVGKELAVKLNSEFVDTDIQITKHLEMAIPDIFSDLGEPAFREEEKKVVQEAFYKQHQVVALGGGAVLDPQNIESITQCGLVVLLWAGTDVLAKRVNNGLNRPLLEGVDAKQRLEQIIRDRYDNYFTSADIVIDTTHLTVGEAAELIENEIRRTFPDRW